eukprot:TRINITY_DN66633_c6_g1_i1.p1 TRINITY_DN66633_c6_g1~~TRINITY_DN66633_c6_g1_i1.p1  ORF type:complete len:431 (-),score=228.58 TRINITY_DN66633_c6_g1_i1:817-2109(-)
MKLVDEDARLEQEQQAMLREMLQDWMQLEQVIDAAAGWDDENQKPDVVDNSLAAAVDDAKPRQQQQQQQQQQQPPPPRQQQQKQQQRQQQQQEDDLDDDLDDGRDSNNNDNSNKNAETSVRKWKRRALAARAKLDEMQRVQEERRQRASHARRQLMQDVADKQKESDNLVARAMSRVNGDAAAEGVVDRQEREEEEDSSSSDNDDSSSSDDSDEEGSDGGAVERVVQRESEWVWSSSEDTDDSEEPEESTALREELKQAQQAKVELLDRSAKLAGECETMRRTVGDLTERMEKLQMASSELSESLAKSRAENVELRNELDIVKASRPTNEVDESAIAAQVAERVAAEVNKVDRKRKKQLHQQHRTIRKLKGRVARLKEALGYSMKQSKVLQAVVLTEILIVVAVLAFCWVSVVNASDSALDEVFNVNFDD